MHAQQATYLPLETPPKEHESNTGKFAPLDWKPGTEHPGQKTFVDICQACHNLNEKQKIGPGLLGISERVPERSRLLKFITEPQSTNDDTYFKPLRDKFADAMAPQGQAAAGAVKGPLTEQQILDVIARLPVAASERAFSLLTDRLVEAGLDSEVVHQALADVWSEPPRFERWNPHRLRHAFAHRAEGATGDLDGVRAVLGHASDAMTRRYAHADERRAIALVEQLG